MQAFFLTKDLKILQKCRGISLTSPVLRTTPIAWSQAWESFGIFRYLFCLAPEDRGRLHGALNQPLRPLLHQEHAGEPGRPDRGRHVLLLLAQSNWGYLQPGKDCLKLSIHEAEINWRGVFLYPSSSPNSFDLSVLSVICILLFRIENLLGAT